MGAAAAGRGGAGTNQDGAGNGVTAPPAPSRSCRRFELAREPRQGRFCGECGGPHPAKEGDLWAESSLLGLKVTFLAVMEGRIYDITGGCCPSPLSPLYPTPPRAPSLPLSPQSGPPASASPSPPTPTVSPTTSPAAPAAPRRLRARGG